MRLRSILSETGTGIRRNIPMLLAVMLVTFISFLFIGAAALMQVQVSQAETAWYDKVEVVVWLCPQGQSQAATCASGNAPTQEQIADIEETIQNDLPQAVSKITYMSAQQFYNEVFVKEYPGGVYQGQTLTPDDMQASLRLKLKDPTKYQEVAQVLNGKQGVEEVVDQQQIFEPVLTVLGKATAVTLSLAAVMIIVAILLTTTTIRMSAASRRDETEIMRLVGASNATIRLPFVLEVALAALLGSIASVLVLAATTKLFVTDWLAHSLPWIPMVNAHDVWLLSPWIILGAVALSVVCSALSLRKYLKV